jgi:hypothetical protein
VGRLPHPFQGWPRSHRRLALVVVCVAAVLPMLLGAIVTPLDEDEPGGRSIIDFELAGSEEEADHILDAWRAQDVIDNAKAIQIFDLVYPLIYCSALAGLCVAASGAWSRAGRPRLAALGIAMAWVAFAAAAFDYVENFGLAISLWDEPASPWPEVAFVAAVLKFGASGLALLFALTGLASPAFRSRHSRSAIRDA